MKVRIIGSGGREHALAWKMCRSDLVTELIAAPGHVGIASEPGCRTAAVSAEDIDGVCRLAEAEKIGLVVVGPEAPLVAGLSDRLRGAGFKVFGPSQNAAQLEGSKAFTRNVLRKYGVPAPDFEVFDRFSDAEKYVATISDPVVVKADGLAAGKGVFVCKDKGEALGALRSIMVDRIFGTAGDRVVVEECLDGEEASFIAITDGETVLPLASSQDHKPVFDLDMGPNTGGMGAYSPAPVVTPAVHERIMNEIMVPVVRAMEAEGNRYLGFLYAGLMIKNGASRVLEFNVRMGDPEAQPLLFRMKTDLVGLMLDAIDGKLAGRNIEWLPDDAVCVVMASGGYPGGYEKGKKISGIDQADAMHGVKVFHAGTAKGSDGYVTAGGRVLGVTSRDMGIEKAVARAYAAAEKISWDGVHYRKDIGKKAVDRLK